MFQTPEVAATWVEIWYSIPLNTLKYPYAHIKEAKNQFKPSILISTTQRKREKINDT